LPVPTPRVGGIDAGQNERARQSEHLPDLGQGGQPAARLGQVVERLVGLHEHPCVHRPVGGQEPRQRRL
jgi:hypothetical protein